MAGYVGDGYRGLDGRLSKEVQAELGILAIPLKQCVVDYLGSQRWRLRAYYFAALPFFLEYQRSSEKSLAVNLISQYETGELKRLVCQYRNSEYILS